MKFSDRKTERNAEERERREKDIEYDMKNGTKKLNKWKITKLPNQQKEEEEKNILPTENKSPKTKSAKLAYAKNGVYVWHQQQKTKTKNKKQQH